MSLSTAEFLLGAICLAGVVAGVFFLRFWRSTGDRLFLFFAASFFLEALNRAVLAFTNPNEAEPHLYLIRLAAYVLIIVGIWDKNRRS